MRKILFLGVAVLGLGCAAAAPEDSREAADEIATEQVATPEDQAAETTTPDSPRFDREFEAAGKEFGVPPAVLKAVAWAETRYEMAVGEEEFDGKPAAFGLMALSGARLEEAARLANVGVDAAKTDPLANVRAGAALLSKLGNDLAIDRAKVSAWEPAIAAFSAIADEDARRSFVRDDVFGTMKQGLGAIAVDPSTFEIWTPEVEIGDQEILAAGPNFPGSIWRPSPNYNSRGGVKPAMVIVHTCEGSYASCWSWLKNPAAGASAHYVVKEDGKEVSQLVNEANRAWHIAASYKCSLNSNVDCFRNGSSSNTFTIGIEHAGFASQKSWPAGEIETAARLACDISKGHGIPRDRYHYVGHGKLQPYNRTDPGPNWPWAQYVTRMNQICAPAPAPAPTSFVVDSNNANNNKAKGYIDVSANWKSTTSVAGYYGTGYWAASAAPVADGATFYFHLADAGTKTIDAHWTSATNRGTAVPFVAVNSLGQKVGQAGVNQRVNGGKWNAIGTWKFTAGWNKIIVSRWTDSGAYVVADAIRVR
jgi:N-acetyl-anhydromuramyl-L-alanine amidase AmpD